MSDALTNNEAYTDVVELCALLQCLGFSVKSLDTSDGNISQDGGMRSVVINCQTSGLHVVLESPSLSCSCPTASNQQNSGVWQVSGVTGGKQLDKEFGCSLLGSLPKSHRERLSKELYEMIKCIKQHNESDIEMPKEAIENKSASMLELKTPEKRDFPIKSETPTRYRSLDTLTSASKRERGQPLPEPGPLHKVEQADASADDSKEKKQIMCRRQSTYTLSSTPGSVRRRNKTSSPIHASQNTLLDGLIAAEKAAADLHNKLAYVIKEFMEDGKHDSSISSLTLDVSKISLLKCADAKAQFASSPNLSGIGMAKDDFTKSRLKRFESASTSNLAPKAGAAKESKLSSKLRRISPNIFKSKKESPGLKLDKGKTLDAKSKLNSLFKPKIVTPVRTPRSNVEASPNLSSSRKKFSHVKSTIPRPSSKKE
ncbi:uncharacterized protein LOC124639008 [Helicoverpa zea]|uniref:uncharacterized protein LOC124639008 n=1 Tax=Helicoverpa zea TaxID=7113 RepID=UPI001F5940E7|nr:uncharacterized protein LOC124639008 [Helicoverpa zea]